MNIELPIVRMRPEAILPSYATSGDAGLDLAAAEDTNVLPGQRRVISTGIAVAIPAGHVGLIHPRSGLAAKSGVTVLNAPGTIDSGYRGEIKIILHNTSSEVFTIWTGDRIAQLVIQEYVHAKLAEVTEFENTERGENGFGSTGV